MKTKNESTPTKSINRLTLAGMALTALVITVLASFAVSGTLAKFIDTVGAQSGAVPAAQFNFNEVYDVETNTFTPIVWNLEQLGATINPSYSSKIFYPGAYGDFSMDVTFISDVPAMAEVTVDYINETGAFLPTVYGQVPDVSLRDLISLNFIAIIKDRGVQPTAEEIDFANDGITVRLGEFEEKLATTLENTIGENGAYYTLGTLIEKTVYVYWKWDFELSTQGNEYDTLFGNYVAKFRDDGIESELGLGVVMIVTQDTLDGSGIVNSLTPQAPTINSEDVIVATTTVTLPVIAGAEYSSDGVNWQDSNVLTGLTGGTEYTVYARIKASGIIPASASDSLNVITIPNAPSLAISSISATSVTITPVAGAEYSLNGTDWQDSNEFTGLSSGTEYTIYARIKAVGEVPVSAVASVGVGTTPLVPATPVLLSVTENAITLTAVSGVVYGISTDGGTNITWQASNVFTELSSVTSYSFYAKVPANGNVPESDISASLSVLTTSLPATTTIDTKTYYLIYNAAELAWFRDRVNGGNGEINGKLMDDIYLNDTTNWASWTATTTGLNSWTPIGNTTSASTIFKGTFDGNGYAVKGIYISTESGNQGLFGYSNVSSSIKNLGVEDSFIKGGYYVGGVAGVGVNISNCYNTSSVSATGDSIGGVVGNGSAIGSYNTGLVSGRFYVGGVVGNGGATNSYNTGNVSGLSSVGGVVGQTNYSSVFNSYNTGSVSGTSSVGGIIGSALNNGLVSNSYNAGSVSGTSAVGGICGRNHNTITISYCYYLGGVPACGSYVSASVPTITGGGTFTNNVSGWNTLLTSLNAYRGTWNEWTRDTNNVINGGLPYFVQ